MQGLTASLPSYTRAHSRLHAYHISPLLKTGHHLFAAPHHFCFHMHVHCPGCALRLSSCGATSLLVPRARVYSLLCSALEFVWSQESSDYAIRESGGRVKIFKNFAEKATVKIEYAIEGMHGGSLIGESDSLNRLLVSVLAHLAQVFPPARQPCARGGACGKCTSAAAQPPVPKGHGAAPPALRGGSRVVNISHNLQFTNLQRCGFCRCARVRLCVLLRLERGPPGAPH